MFLERSIFSYIEKMRKQFKIILLIGSRQVGKSTLLKQKLPSEFDYVSLDDYNELDLANLSFFTYKTLQNQAVLDVITCKFGR